jgi:replicative DNA helicase
VSTAGRKLLSSIVNTSDLNSFINLGLTAVLFKEGENILFKFIQEHVGKFGVIPQPDTIEEKLGDVLTSATEPPEYYMDEVERRYLHNSMKSMIVECGEFLGTADPVKAYELAMARMMDLNQVRNRHNLIDFKEAALPVYKQYMQTKANIDSTGIPFGLPTLDAMTGGLVPGDFCSIVGRPASGKTFQLLAMALYGWRHANQTPLFDSLEMNAIIIQQRLAAMDAHKNLTHLIKGMMTTKAFKDMMDSLEANKKALSSLWVMDANLSGDVDGLVMLCRQLKPSACYVDGAYMLEHPDKRLDKFARIGANAESMKKRIAGNLGIPVVASYQLNRDSTKKKNGKKDETQEQAVGIEDIYGSDTIGQVSSVVLGLLQKEGIETKLFRDVSVLKGRNGESGKIRINWDFKNMDFSEVKKEEEGGEMNFL